MTDQERNGWGQPAEQQPGQPQQASPDGMSHPGYGAVPPQGPAQGYPPQGHDYSVPPQAQQVPPSISQSGQWGYPPQGYPQSAQVPYGYPQQGQQPQGYPQPQPGQPVSPQYRQQATQSLNQLKAQAGQQIGRLDAMPLSTVARIPLFAVAGLLLLLSFFPWVAYYARVGSESGAFLYFNGFGFLSGEDLGDLSWFSVVLSLLMVPLVSIGYATAGYLFGQPGKQRQAAGLTLTSSALFVYWIIAGPVQMAQFAPEAGRLFQAMLVLESRENYGELGEFIAGYFGDVEVLGGYQISFYLVILVLLIALLLTFYLVRRTIWQEKVASAQAPLTVEKRLPYTLMVFAFLVPLVRTMNFLSGEVTDGRGSVEVSGWGVMSGLGMRELGIRELNLPLVGVYAGACALVLFLAAVMMRTQSLHHYGLMMAKMSSIVLLVFALVEGVAAMGMGSAVGYWLYLLLTVLIVVTAYGVLNKPMSDFAAQISAPQTATQTAQTVPSQPAPAQSAQPAQPAPGQPVPGYAASGQSVAGQPAPQHGQPPQFPVQPAPGQPGQTTPQPMQHAPYPYGQPVPPQPQQVTPPSASTPQTSGQVDTAYNAPYSQPVNPSIPPSAHAEPVPSEAEETTRLAADRNSFPVWNPSEETDGKQ